LKRDGRFETKIASGVLGVRGDVRISGHFIDGNSGVLAYNFFPNFGDMVIDTGDNTYNNTASNSLILRNILAHEHGHGLGISHVCPVNQTKLMEPFLTTAFDGPQPDDILAGNRGYGDDNEHNDTPGTATGLVCANAFRNGMWGDRLLTKALPCALTAGLATATGVYRLKGDEHWPTDVLVGLLVGFGVGWLDLPNLAARLHRPLGVEWLKENTSVVDARLTPTLEAGAVGLRFDVRH